MSDASFDDIAGVVRDYGAPYEGGISLRYSGDRPQVSCRECGPLPAEVHRWSGDWLALCQEARHHALEKGHEVAVSLWNGAIYGPRRLYWNRHPVPSQDGQEGLAAKVLWTARAHDHGRGVPDSP